MHRRLWDGPARAEADRLTRAWPAWLVLYSLGRRRFYAIAAWPTPEPSTVADDTAEGLEEQMREVETAFPPTVSTPFISLPSPSPERPTASPLQASPRVPPSPGRPGGTASSGRAWRRATAQAYAAAPQHSRHPYRRAA
ncbi:hypothetical protein [Streptosporangium carneum]|uniref:hypothetical protein n=1 Tax=Streptosporangium carneum TaxID=47481 RepID=UPI0022F2D23D|nr:hypothetical protein [Streptosporangium carneum]